MPNHPNSVSVDSRSLQKFQEYIEEKSAAHVEVDAGDILKIPRSPQSQIELNYLSPEGEAFVGVLDAKHSLLRLRHGRLNDAGWMRWDSAEENRYIPQACEDFQKLAELSGSVGNRDCQKAEFLLPESTEPSGLHYLALTAAPVAVLEGAGLAVNSLAKYNLKFEGKFQNWFFNSSSEGWGKLEGPRGFGKLEEMPRTAAGRFAFRSPALLMGASAILGSKFLADELGWHPEHHRLERHALGVYMAQRGMSLQTGALGVIAVLPTVGTETPLQINNRLSASFGSRLLSSRLVDATIGKIFDQGSTARFATQMAGFFVPDLLILGLGQARLGFLNNSKVRVASGWINRLMLTAFVADIGFMFYNHLDRGTIGSAAKHHILQRANDLQSPHRGVGGTLLKGAADLVIPAISESMFVDEQYVEQASQEVLQGAELEIEAIRGFLLSSLLVGDPLQSGEEDFYHKVDWSWLQGKNELGDVHLPPNRWFPLGLLQDDLKAPAFGGKFKAKENIAEQVAMLRRQYRGYDLSDAEVQFLLGRLSVYQMRKRIVELKWLDEKGQSKLLRCFDREGALIPSMRGALLQELFKDGEGGSLNASKIYPYPELNQLEESTVELRNVALTLRLIDILSNAKDEEWEALSPMALRLGLVNEKKELVAGSFRDYAVEQWKKLHPGQVPALSFEERPKPALAPPPPGPSKADIIKGI
ncbi:MAG TPA: hypothetical protein VJR29_06850, partial [bacterium]|nr:hypothetical protein [bacterium]